MIPNILETLGYDTIRTQYASLDTQTWREVNRAAFAIGHDVSSCEFYGISYMAFRNGEVLTAAMVERGILEV